MISPTTTRTLLVLAISVVVLAAAGTWVGPGATSEASPKGVELRTVVTISSSSDSLLTVVTSPGAEKGRPLSAAFLIQHSGSPPYIPDYRGETRLVYQVDEVGHPVSLWVQPKDRQGWFFTTDGFKGSAPSGTALVESAGLARYSWGEKAEKFPTSHEEFARERFAALTQAGGTCGCSGGPGSSSCTCTAPGGGSCSVTCRSGFYACCNSPGECYCVPERSGGIGE